MNKHLESIEEKFTILFLDDIIDYSKDMSLINGIVKGVQQIILICAQNLGNVAKKDYEESDDIHIGSMIALATHLLKILIFKPDDKQNNTELMTTLIKGPTDLSILLLKRPNALLLEDYNNVNTLIGSLGRQIPQCIESFQTPE